MAMENQEISVVISRAAELHANISAAIDRALNSDRTSTSLNEARELRSGADLLHNPASQQHHLPRSNSRGLAEARSLTSIRDALEVLAEQLECLKTLQQQQRAEKDATLAELEESREIFIRRLKQHRGRERKVINEALSFAGDPEPLQEQDDLPLPPYPTRLATDPSAFAKLDVPISSAARKSPADEDATFEQFIFTEDDVKCDHGIYSAVDEDYERIYGSERGESMHQNDVRRPFVPNGCLFGVLKNRIFRFFSSKVGKASGKIFLVLAGVAALAYGRQRSFRSGGRVAFVGSNISTELWQKSRTEVFPPDKSRDLPDGGVQKSVDRERIEIPFEEALRSPDVSYGLG